ncbi:hypothetical protein ACDF64_04990 [Agromyces sp. MMS24-JH15]|uniref:hypothetical protein n=1 Tax=Agromyces sp. MMS24-JH15 TaxID=3243765 RepID=UPI00374A66F0
MAFGKPTTPPAKTGEEFTVTLHVGAGDVDVVMSTENLSAGPSAIWAIIATKIQNNGITGLKTPDGRDVIVNWGQVGAVTYRNPW